MMGMLDHNQRQKEKRMRREAEKAAADALAAQSETGDDMGEDMVRDDGTGPETPEDAAQLADHEWPMYEEEWNFCLTMAFMHCGVDYLTDWGDIPFRIATFMLNNPDAPVEAALIEIKMRTRVVVLPNEDQRRVHLALTLFRAYVLGWHAIEGQDVQAKITADEQARYLARPPQKLDMTDTPFETVAGPFDPSDLGKAR